LTANVTAVVDKAKAVSPDLIAALNIFGERALIEKISEAMAPLAILGGGSVVDVVKKLFESSQLSKHLDALNCVKNHE
jgi:major vault protein